MSIFKPINQDCRGYTDQYECIKCKAYIYLPCLEKQCDYNYCPYCSCKNTED